MSLWARCKAKLTSQIIRNPDAKKLLVEAIQDVVREITGKVPEIVEGSIVTGWATHEKVDIAVMMPHVWGNGFGVKVSGDTIEFVGDTHGLEASYGISLQELAERIQQRYVEKAVEYALSWMGYAKAEVRETEEAREIVFVKYL